MSRKAHRSAESGRFVTKAEAKANPSETVQETISTGRKVDHAELSALIREVVTQEGFTPELIADRLIAEGYRKDV